MKPSCAVTKLIEWYGLRPFVAYRSADPAVRARVVDGLVAFCQTHGYDGADLDWEYPTAADCGNFVALAAELSAAFRAQQPALSLSAAIPSVDWRNSYDVPGLRDAFDWFGVMTYDYHGSWTAHAGHNSPLYVSGGDPEGAIDTAVRGWRQKGIPDAKLLPGFAFYGREFLTEVRIGAEDPIAVQGFPGRPTQEAGQQLLSRACVVDGAAD